MMGFITHPNLSTRGSHESCITEGVNLILCGTQLL